MLSIHFFSHMWRNKVTVSQDTKYFCITEAVALYLQKFILYRKRKVFYGTDGTNKSLFDVMSKHKDNISFLYVCSENQQDNNIVNWLKSNNCDFELAFMYRSETNDIKKQWETNTTTWFASSPHLVSEAGLIISQNSNKTEW